MEKLQLSLVKYPIFKDSKYGDEWDLSAWIMNIRQRKKSWIDKETGKRVKAEYGDNYITLTCGDLFQLVLIGRSANILL